MTGKGPRTPPPRCRAKERKAQDIGSRLPERRSCGARISFDPNLRESLWDNLTTAKEQLLWGCSVCEVLKLAEEELEFLTGCDAIDADAARLRRDYPNIRLLLVTRGKAGSVALWRSWSFTVPPI